MRQAPLWTFLVLILGAAGIDIRLDNEQSGYGVGDQESTEKSLLQQVIGDQKPLCSSGIAVAKRNFQVYSPAEHIQGLRKEAPQFADALTDCFDYGYAFCPFICGMTQHQCEQLARKCIDKACAAHEEPDDCEDAGDKQLTRTKMFIVMKFRDRQHEACQCVSHFDAAARRKEELEEFYDKWAPEPKAAKVGSVMKKYESKNFRGWGLLMFTLHQKYRQSVVLREAGGSFDGMQRKVFPPPAPDHTEL